GQWVLVLSLCGVMDLATIVTCTLFLHVALAMSRMDWSPPVMAAMGPVVPVAPVVTASVVVLSPMREMALPPMVTGTVTGATTCVPEATASDPLVTACTPSPPLDAGADWVVASVVVLSPTTEIAFPPTVTGTDTEMIPCVPDSRPPAPEVVADELVAVGCAGGALVVAP